MRYQRIAIGLTTIAVTALAIAESGVAAADSSTDVTGQKYSDAESALSGAGMKPIVESTVGDQKPWPDCLVTRTQKRIVQPPPNSSGSQTSEVLVSLNCDSGVASATTPGDSAASPEGRAAAAAAASAKADG